MDKITIDFTGLTAEQTSEIQSIVDSKLTAFREENKKQRLYLSVKDQNAAFMTYIKNAKPEPHYDDVWNAAIKWCKESAI